MVSLGDIAKTTGYSKTTVLRMLSRDPSFTAKESTRHRVTQVANKLGHVLHSSRSGILQVMAVLENFDATRGPQDTYFADVRDALRECAVKNMMSLPFFSDVDSLVEAGDDFAGFVSLGPAPIASEDLGRLHEALAHGVFTDINPAPTLFHSVRPNSQRTIIEAVYALREQGRERIAFIGRDGHMVGSYVFARDPRTFAFGEWACLLGMPTDGCVYTSGPFTVDSGRDQAEAPLDAHTEAMPDAILVAVDPLAVGVIRALMAYGVRIPEEIAVLSINNLEVCQYTAPALSSYATERSEPTETALMLLSGAVVGRFRHKYRMLLSTRLVPRQSFIPAEDTPRNRSSDAQRGGGVCFSPRRRVASPQERQRHVHDLLVRRINLELVVDR